MNNILSASSVKYFIGVDGGGSGSRAIVANSNWEILAFAEGPPSALGQGIEKSWKAILETITHAFHKEKIPVPMLSQCAIGLGLSGANHISWKNEFYLRNPGFKNIIVDTDGFTTLLGAHEGKPGVVVAVGTGSVGMILTSDQKRIDVSGWGFPSGDEASGAWLGLQAAAIAEKTLDKRLAPSVLSDLVLSHCGKTPADFLFWLAQANQFQFAKLAPLVFKAAPEDLLAKNLLISAGIEIESMALTLDPSKKLPLSICGRLGEALISYLPEDIKSRHRAAKGNSSTGALLLISREFSEKKI